MELQGGVGDIMVRPQLLSFTAPKKKQYFSGIAYRTFGMEALKARG